jgi:hypothetical protein
MHPYLAENRRGALETRLGKRDRRTSLSLLFRGQRLTPRRERPPHGHMRSHPLRSRLQRLRRASRPRGRRAFPPRAPPHGVPTSREPRALAAAEAPIQRDAFIDGGKAYTTRPKSRAPTESRSLRPCAGARSLLAARTARVSARARARRAPGIGDGAERAISVRAASLYAPGAVLMLRRLDVVTHLHVMPVSGHDIIRIATRVGSQVDASIMVGDRVGVGTQISRFCSGKPCTDQVRTTARTIVAPVCVPYFPLPRALLSFPFGTMDSSRPFDLAFTLARSILNQLF